MNSRLPVLLSLAFAVLAIAGCSDEGTPATRASASSQDAPAKSPAARTPAEVSRWYGADAVARGAPIFSASCASCHGERAQGTPAWREKGADGRFPPPPLDGTAHAWHHPLPVLASQIKFGTPGGNGNMPGFAGTLSDEQVLDVIAWIQSLWPDAIYAAWYDIDSRSRSANR